MVNLDQALVLGLLEHLETRSEAFGRSPKARHVADVVGRREQKNATRGFGQLLHPRPKHILDRPRRPAGMLVPSPVARPRHEGKLQQCERIPERALDQRFHLRVCDTLALAQPHELPRISIRDSVQPQFGQACSLEAPLLPLPCRDQHSDRFRQQTAGHEDKRVGRGPIQPLGVVDQAKDRAVTRRLSEQAEERERAQETIVHLIGGQAERGAKRRRLRSGQTVDKRHARPDELMQRGERKLVLGLHAGAPKDLGLRGSTGAELEQRRLADARLPAKHQNTAPSLHGVRHQRFDLLLLGLASDNHATDCPSSSD